MSGERFELMRLSLGISKGEMAEKLGITRDTWRRYIEGDLPTGEIMKRIAGLGFSIDWLVTGNGAMRGQPFAHGAVIDAEMMAQITNGLVRLYDEEGQVLAPSEQGRISAQIYNELLLTAEESERRTILRHLLRVRQRDLHEARLTTASSKRSG